MAYYKDNSDRQRNREEVTEQPPVKRVTEKVANGQVTAPKKTWRDYARNFLTKGSKSVGAYLLEDVLMPSAQKTAVDLAKAVSDTFVSGISTVVYHGEAPKRPTNASRASYAGYYEARERGYLAPPPRAVTYEDVSFETRGEAEEVLNALDDLMATYQLVRVADLYELAGVSFDYTANNYGWTDISAARVERSRYDSRFVIRMPRPMPITNG